MERKLRHPIVVYTATEAKATHQLTHQLTRTHQTHTPAHRRASTSHQLTTDAYLRGGESNLYCFVPRPIL